jgi:hypothetical protein
MPVRHRSFVVTDHLSPIITDDREWLGEKVGKIRNVGPSHPAFSLYDPLNQINDDTSQYHHGDNVSDTVSDQIDPTELRGFARRTLRIVNAMQA